MTRIWIEEYAVTGDLGRMLGHFLDMDESIKTAYLISPSEGDESVSPSKKILFEFLEYRNDFPLYLYFSDEYVLRERHQQFFQLHDIDYTIQTFYPNRKHHMDPLVYFTVELKDKEALRRAVRETYWLGEENVFYAISNYDNLKLMFEERQHWGFQQYLSVASFDRNPPSVLIKPGHDGCGFFICSNDVSMNSLKNVIQSMPEKIIIYQINDELYEPEDEE
ncbi:hypothetical protein RCC94_02905 [Exiguobacterium acetylicum]|uniref:hypothetical protein n=1 Tax=Exiguobacterium acetylicum TaxID=41170 RepID=UPI0027DED584|nr:hypothetical protein [Exiguobacterium acetylicum]MDQ6466418.1 hypothetical protein [Exiguobacterium acetylicum]